MARVKLRCIMICPGLKSNYWKNIYSLKKSINSLKWMLVSKIEKTKVKIYYFHVFYLWLTHWHISTVQTMFRFCHRFEYFLKINLKIAVTVFVGLSTYFGVTVLAVTEFVNGDSDSICRIVMWFCKPVHLRKIFVIIMKLKLKL